MRDVVIVGAGAAGLAAAIFARRRHPDLPVILLDGAKKPGAKILVSGGGRCNVTNTVVTAEDFRGGSRSVVRRILLEFDAARAASFFRDIGVPLHEEPGGKLFPDSNKARSVLDALLGEADRRGVRLMAGQRVTEVRRDGAEFQVVTTEDSIPAHRVVLATGGLSIPKTGSDGLGYRIAGSLGHTIVPTTPALVPLLLERGFHADLAGISLDVEISVRVERSKAERIRGALLWTHFGVSGPSVLDASRIWLRARLEGKSVEIHVSLIPGETPESIDSWMRATAKERPTAALATVLATRLPARLADRLAPDSSVRMAHLPREDRRRIVESIARLPLAVSGSRGYNYAEVTAGGVPLDEVDPRTLESRKCPGLHLVGEILDVDGRIGGFNFQWAWATGWVCAGGLA
ncbi:MAG TPA: NAD(P)/FAD-dependent oxidoreductase [Planctomycetota bacterium]|nr:NAD(P)/FAD-dependent oxidoreductase [Planctomycetota bacterium]